MDGPAHLTSVTAAYPQYTVVESIRKCIWEFQKQYRYLPPGVAFPRSAEKPAN